MASSHIRTNHAAKRLPSTPFVWSCRHRHPSVRAGDDHQTPTPLTLLKVAHVTGGEGDTDAVDGCALLGGKGLLLGNVSHLGWLEGGGGGW